MVLITAGIHIQIEHHLFPALSSDRVLPLVPIVEATCKEFGVNNKNFKTFPSILDSVHAYIDTLAFPNKPEAARRGRGREERRQGRSRRRLLRRGSRRRVEGGREGERERGRGVAGFSFFVSIFDMED